MITKEMIIGDIIRQHPVTVLVFQRYNLDCHECQLADLETLEHGMEHHKLNITVLLEELNQAAFPA